MKKEEGKMIKSRILLLLSGPGPNRSFTEAELYRAYVRKYPNRHIAIKEGEVSRRQGLSREEFLRNLADLVRERVIERFMPFEGNVISYRLRVPRLSMPRVGITIKDILRWLQSAVRKTIAKRRNPGR